MEAIRRDFLVKDLEKVLHEAGIAGAIAVQARQTLAETNWLLELAGGLQCDSWRGRMGAADQSKSGP